VYEAQAGLVQSGTVHPPAELVVLAAVLELVAVVLDELVIPPPLPLVDAAVLVVDDAPVIPPPLVLVLAGLDDALVDPPPLPPEPGRSNE
jgi:hypothetical protein